MSQGRTRERAVGFALLFRPLVLLMDGKQQAQPLKGTEFQGYLAVDNGVVIAE